MLVLAAVVVTALLYLDRNCIVIALWSVVIFSIMVNVNICGIRSCISGIGNHITEMRASMWRMWRGIGTSNHFLYTNQKQLD